MQGWQCWGWVVPMWDRAVSHPSGDEWEMWGVGKWHFSLCCFPWDCLTPCCKTAWDMTWGEQCFRRKLCLIPPMATTAFPLPLVNICSVPQPC